MLDWIKLFAFIAAVALGIKSCSDSQWYNERENAIAAKEKAKNDYEAQPRVIREVDGCKVYTFKSVGNWHYFTRCPNQVSTDTTISYQEKQGKGTITKQRVETIVTEGK